ncbi:MAG: hypothetical protein ABIS27_00720 [Longimicrobiales bacterium]
MRTAIMLAGGALMLCVTYGCSDKGKKSDAPAADSIPMVTRATWMDSLHRPLGRVRRMPTLMGRIRIANDSPMVNMDLYSQPDGFPLRFTTYKVSDMTVSTMKIGSSSSITLSPLFNGTPDPQAYVQIQFDSAAPPASGAAEAAIKLSTSGMKPSDLRVTPSDEYPWATAASSFRYEASNRSFAGMVLIGRRGTQTFRIFVHYPVELASQMAPRVKLVIQQWRWSDDYTYLVPA